ncbi:hypothetical protein ACI5KX_09480 [Erythrobacter sp. GH1-10]|uniref:hypothetical protein n=1 Tax=Erythrobacter sp. GH1-10 TaxID=3349334 RepID=UPI003877BD35
MTDMHIPASEKRDELRAKIEASERRIAERTFADQAKEVADSAAKFTKDNPLTVIGGAVAIGLLLGLATPPGRRLARSAASGTANAVGSAAKGTADIARNASMKQVNRFGSLISDAVIAYGIKLIDQAMDTARAGKDKAEDLSDSASSKARQVRRDAEYHAGNALDKTRTMTRRSRRRAERAVRDIKGRVTN